MRMAEMSRLDRGCEVGMFSVAVMVFFSWARKLADGVGTGQ